MKQNRIFWGVFTLLSIMAIPLCLAIGFLIKQEIIAHQMFEKLEKGAQKNYQFPLQDISWVKEGKELLVRGKMFDVKNFKIKNNYIEVTGIFDEEEDALKQTFAHLLYPLKSSSSPLQNCILKSIFAPVFFETATIKIPEKYSCTIQKSIINYKEICIQKSYPITTPPPKAFS